jgi:hypothetical protein
MLQIHIVNFIPQELHTCKPQYGMLQMFKIDYTNC